MRTSKALTMRTSRRVRHSMSALVMAGLVGISSFTGVMTYAPSAHAAEPGEVSPKGKGIVGGALLGGEIVVIGESIAGVRPTWAYLAGFGVGAVGGGIGGYFIEQGSTDGRVPIYMLAGGLALIIPAVVLTLNATRYMPSEDATEDHAPTNLPAADPGAAGGSAVGSPAPAVAPPSSTPAVPATPAPAPAPASPPAATPPAGGGGGAPVVPLSLFHMQGGTFRLGLPVPEVRPMFSMTELRQYGMAQQTEVRMGLVKVLF